jgi:hypothetical protein
MGRTNETIGERKKLSVVLRCENSRKGTTWKNGCASEDNIKMELKKIELGNTDWISIAYSRGQWKVYCIHDTENFYLKMDTAEGNLTHLHGHLLLLLIFLTLISTNSESYLACT